MNETPDLIDPSNDPECAGLRARLDQAAKDAAGEQEMAHSPTEKAFHEGRVSAYHAAAEWIDALPSRDSEVREDIEALRLADDDPMDYDAQNHTDAVNRTIDAVLRILDIHSSEAAPVDRWANVGPHFPEAAPAADLPESH